MATSSNQPALVHKSLGVEGCKVVDDEKGIVEAYVSGIGNKDSGGDIIVPGAFNASLQQRTPKGVWSHDWDKPVSKTLEIYEVPAGDPRLPMKMQLAEIGGLYVKTQFNLNTQLGRDAYETVKFFGEESEWSIGYQVDDAEYDHDQKAMILKEISLYEYSPVLFGMNELTSTVSIKAHKGDDGELEYEVEGLEEVEEKAVKAALDVIFKDKQMSADLEDYGEKPWHIEKRSDKYCVIKDSDGSNAGCHDTRKEAEDHMSALYASENGDEKSTEEDIEQKSEDTISASVKWVATDATSNSGYYQWTTTGTDWFKTGFGANDDSRITELEGEIVELKDLVKTLIDESREARKTDEDREFEAAIAGVELLKGLKVAASEKLGTAFPTEIKWEEGAAKFRVWDEVEAKEAEEAYSFDITEEGIELTEKTDIFEEKVEEEEEVTPEVEEAVETEEKAEEAEEKVEEEVADEKTEETDEPTDEVVEEESDEKSDESEETEEKVEEEVAEEKAEDDSEVEDSVEDSEEEKSEETEEIEHKEDEVVDDDAEFFRNLAEFEELLSD